MPIWPGLAKVLIRTGLAQRIPSIQRVMGDGLPYLRYYNRRILASPNVELQATQAMLSAARPGTVDLTLGAPYLEVNWDPLDVPALHEYPPLTGIDELKEALAERLSETRGLDYDPKHQILVCNGVSQAIGLMLDTFVEPGGAVAVFDPSFFIYRLAAQNREIRVRQIPTWFEDGYTCFHEQKLKRALRGTSVLFVNSPNNPTGSILSEDSLDRIAYWCQRYDVLIFADEVYERFIYDGTHQSIAACRQAQARTIIANSFSKTYGMAGARVGYLAGPRYMVQPMVVTYLSTAPFVSLASQHWALAALQQKSNWFPQLLHRFRNRRDRVSELLSRLKLAHAWPRGAFFFWVDVHSLGYRGVTFADQLLQEQGVLVMPGESCGKSGHRHIRISFAGRDDLLEDGLTRLVRFCADHFGTDASLAIEPVGMETVRRAA